ncbi:MAG: hypothetical protein M3Q36_04470 [bacterium]|nr:hypothetical protein [bacterium]
MDKLITQLKPIIGKFKRYGGLILMVIFSIMYGVLIYNSNKLAQEQPSETKINEKFQGAKRPKIDDRVAEQLSGLEEQNIQIKGIFDQARKNPFSE